MLGCGGTEARRGNTPCDQWPVVRVVGITDAQVVRSSHLAADLFRCLANLEPGVVIHKLESTVTFA